MKISLVTGRKDLGGKFPEVKAALDAQEAIIDGEIVALNKKGHSSFQALRGFDMGKELLTGIRTTNVLIGDHNKISLYAVYILRFSDGFWTTLGGNRLVALSFG